MYKNKLLGRMKKFFSKFFSNIVLILVKVYDSLLNGLVYLLSFLPPKLLNKVYRGFEIFGMHVVQVVFIYSFIRLLLFVTFSFKFEFIMAIGIIVSGVTIFYYFDLSAKFLAKMQQFIVHYYSTWKFRFSFLWDGTSQDWGLIVYNVREPNNSWFARLIRAWYRWSVAYSLIYLMEMKLVSSIVGCIFVVLLYFKLYFLIYLLIFLVNSGRIVPAMSYKYYDKYKELRLAVFDTEIYGAKFSKWGVYYLEHFYLYDYVYTKALESAKRFIDHCKECGSPVERLDLFVGNNPPLWSELFTFWLSYCSSCEDQEEIELPEISLFYFRWEDERKEQNLHLFRKFDQYKNVGVVLDFMYIFLFLLLIFRVI